MPFASRPSTVWFYLTVACCCIVNFPDDGQLPVAYAAGGVTYPSQCARDEALEKATVAIIHSDAKWTASALIKLARENGSDVPAIYFISVPGSASAQRSAIKQWLDERKKNSDAPLVCGITQDGTRTVVLASSRAGSLHVEPRGAGKSGWKVTGELVKSFKDPSLMVRQSDRETRKISISAQDLREGVVLDDDLAPPFEVQLLAHGPWGPRPVAERIIGNAAKLAPKLPARGGTLVERVALLRQHYDVPTLRPHSVLAKVAKQHATHMCEQGRIGHTLEPGQTPRARVEQAGITAQSVGEALARAATADDGLDKIIDSPSHFALVVDRKFTDVGIGEATDAKGQACVVILLAAWPRWKGR